MTVTLDHNVAHSPLARRTVVTIVLNGGSLDEREAMAQAILAQIPLSPPLQLAPRPSGRTPELTPGLTSVFALLSNSETHSSSPQDVGRDSRSAYDEPFILAPL